MLTQSEIIALQQLVRKKMLDQLSPYSLPHRQIKQLTAELEMRVTEFAKMQDVLPDKLDIEPVVILSSRTWNRLYPNVLKRFYARVLFWVFDRLDVELDRAHASNRWWSLLLFQNHSIKRCHFPYPTISVTLNVNYTVVVPASIEKIYINGVIQRGPKTDKCQFVPSSEKTETLLVTDNETSRGLDIMQETLTDMLQLDHRAVDQQWLEGAKARALAAKQSGIVPDTLEGKVVDAIWTPPAGHNVGRLTEEELQKPVRFGRGMRFPDSPNVMPIEDLVGIKDPTFAATPHISKALDSASREMVGVHECNPAYGNEFTLMLDETQNTDVEKALAIALSSIETPPNDKDPQ